MGISAPSFKEKEYIENETSTRHGLPIFQHRKIAFTGILFLEGIWRQFIQQNVRITCNFFQPSLTRMKNSVLSLR